jgi:hypothetical protein
MKPLDFQAGTNHAPVRSENVLIARRGMRCFKNIRGSELRVVRGSVWLTQSGSTEDISLVAGESFRITRHGLTIVCADHDTPFTSIMVEPPPSKPTFAERIYTMIRPLLGQPSMPGAARH